VTVALFGYERDRVTVTVAQRRKALLVITVIRGVVPAGFQPFS